MTFVDFRGKFGLFWLLFYYNYRTRWLFLARPALFLFIFVYFVYFYCIFTSKTLLRFELTFFFPLPRVPTKLRKQNKLRISRPILNQPLKYFGEMIFAALVNCDVITWIIKNLEDYWMARHNIVKCKSISFDSYN